MYPLVILGSIVLSSQRDMGLKLATSVLFQRA